ncbi:DUF6011 domain-containing protein [Solibacillus sp. FSL H8-0523]|uniref:DUF6011 domain-containing protein n=1 Tax=Solibacillus sp. FSL H8-0523 TaxID=2954511 RepID=UPI003100DCD1
MQQCARCNRQLKSEKSMELGYGPTCYRKHLKEQADAEFLRNQMTIDEVIQHEERRKSA